MIVLAAEDLAIGYGAKTVATGIDLALPAGSITCLLGADGVGKTTLFKTCLGFNTPLAGTVRFGDHDLSLLSRLEIARHLAYVPQSYVGPFAYRVLDLVVMGRTAYLGAFGTPGRTDMEIALDALRSVCLAHLAGENSNRISGGQR